MIPSLSSFTSSSSSSSSSSSAFVTVDKATSELLVGPDWSINIEICDLCNSNQWMAKNVVKGVKRRLQHKNPRVQLLTLTLLETMVKNCGEYIHFQIAERKLLDELIKIVKKKGDMNVRNKILILLDSWQEAFGGPGGKYSQYYWACEELRRYGIRFPVRPEISAPVITPPVTHQPIVPRIAFDMPSYSSQRLDEAMASEVEGVSLSTLESMRSALELLIDMLQAVNPSDRIAVKNEVILDLVDRCRTNQKKLIQMIATTTWDEDLLSQGLEMNDTLQSVLAKHDAIASGAPLPDHDRLISSQQSEVDLKANSSETGDKHPIENGKSTVSHAPFTKDQVEDEEEEDGFALLARRHSKTQSGPSQSDTSGVTENGVSSRGNNNALALIDTPSTASASTSNVSKDQDLIDLLSIVVTTSSPTETPEAPKSAPVQSSYETSFNSYVVPWAHPQSQPQPQQMVQSQPQLRNPYQFIQPQMQQGQQTKQGCSQYASSYPPPPWEVTSGYTNQNLRENQYMYPNHQGNMNYASQYPQYGNQPMYSTAQTSTNFTQNQTNRFLQQFNSLQKTSSTSINRNLYPSPEMANTSSLMPMQGVQSVQHTDSFPSKAGNPSTLNGTTLVTNGSAGTPSGQKPFVPSYRLFEDLNVFGSSEGKLKSGPYPSASGNQIKNTVLERR